MKIACQSCQAKYTIADEKVLGKVVKIRCKKCGSTIVVNGQEGGGAPIEESTQIQNTSGDFGAGAAAGEEGWTVNVSDNDQRTMTTHQVVAEFARGTITDETYCWRDGMGDWLPLREIEELASACGISQASAFAQQAAAASAEQRVEPATGSVRPAAAAVGGGNALAGIFGGAGAAAAASSGTAARRARTGGADLFGAAAEAGGENDVMTSAPRSAPGSRGGADEAKRMGERNENSVLFSLNALTANQPKGNGGDGKLVGAAEGDGSGLIDIRALSSSMSSNSGPKKPSHVDDIMNLGGGGAFSAALAAPVLTAAPVEPPDAGAPAASNKKMFVMFGALALLMILGMVGIYVALKPSGAAPIASTTPEGPASAAAPPSPGSAAPATPSPATPTPSVAATAPAAADTVAANDPGVKAPSVGVQPRAHGGNAGSSPRESAPAPAAPPSPPPAAPQGLDQAIARSMGGGGAPAALPQAAASNAEFDRGAAAAALGNIANSVGSCKKPGGPTGDGHVQITFSPDGSVRSAIVDQPPFAGTAVGGCVAGKFRGAHVPAFSGGPIPVGKRFSIN